MALEDILGEELYEQVNEKLDENTELIVNDGNYIPRDRLNDKNEQIEQLENQLEQKETAIQERDQQLEQLKEDTQATEELQQKVEQFQERNSELEQQMEEQQEKFQQQLQQQKLNDQLELAVEKADPRDDVARKAIISNLDRDQIELDDDGNIQGVNDQLESMQENATYLFGGEERYEGNGPDEGTGNTDQQPDPDEMSDAEYIAYREEQMQES